MSVKKVEVSSYSKYELGKLYKVTWPTLKKWLRKNEKLKNNREIFGVKKIIPPKLVKEIFEFLGEP